MPTQPVRSTSFWRSAMAGKLTRVVGYCHPCKSNMQHKMFHGRVAGEPCSDQRTPWLPLLGRGISTGVSLDLVWWQLGNGPGRGRSVPCVHMTPNVCT